MKHPPAPSRSPIADMFERYAARLEIDGANPFRVRAYRDVARTVADLEKAAEAGELHDLDGFAGEI